MGLLIFCLVSPALAYKQRLDAWYFNLEGYELVFVFDDNKVGSDFFTSHRHFKADASGKNVGWVKTIGSCTNSAKLDGRDHSRPQILDNTNGIFEAYLRPHRDRYRAFIRNRATGEVIEGEDIFDKAAEQPDGKYRLNHLKTEFKKCKAHREHYDQLAKKYGVPVLDEEYEMERYEAWLFDIEGYKLVYGYNYRGYLGGHVTSWPNYEISKVTDAFGDIQYDINARPGGRNCTGSAKMPERKLPGPSKISKTHGLMEFRMSNDHKKAWITNKKTGETYSGVSVKELASRSPNKTFTLRNRTTRRKCYVGDTDETHKQFFKRLKNRN